MDVKVRSVYMNVLWGRIREGRDTSGQSSPQIRTRNIRPQSLVRRVAQRLVRYLIPGDALEGKVTVTHRRW